MRQIILASQSPQRKTLLEKLGIVFEVVPSNIDEKSIVASTPKDRVQKIAMAKAEVVQLQFPDAILIAGDTFAVVDDRVLEKPSSLDEATEMLSVLSGKTVEMITGLAYLDPQLNRVASEFASTSVTFRLLSQQEIIRYVSDNPVTTWSASFSAAYPEGIALVASVEGSLTSFTHGLPIERVAELLRQSGVVF